jgi:phosphatidylglycerol---prolipoprotein diacylglyceryl transferase
MMPVLYRFVFDSPGSHTLLYLVALALVVYAAWSGYRGAHGGPDPKNPGDFLPASEEAKKSRAIQYGLVGIGLAGLGLYYALPEVPFIGKGKGEGIPIHSYGVLVGGGFIAAVTVSSWLAYREWPGEEGARKRDQVLDLAFYVFIGAMIGSRILFIIVNWKDYADHPSRIFDLGGGLVFYGGLIGAAITAFWYARKHDIEFLRLADIAMPTVSLGQALGRLGCFSAGCCWGDITTEAYKWGVHFPGANAKNLFGGPAGISSLAYQSQEKDMRFVVEATGKVLHDQSDGAVRIADWAASHGHTLPVHPTQLYESLGQTVLFVSLLTLRRFRRFHGMIFGLWLICYAMLRSTVELFRGDVERGTLHGLLNYLGMPSLAEKVPLEAWYNMSISQFISLCMFTLGATVLVRGAQAVNAQPRVDFKALAIAANP